MAELDELEAIVNAARVAELTDAETVAVLLANPEVVLRALGGVQAGGERMESPLHFTGSCWRFDAAERNYSDA